jgi:ankyrin repeat protein
MWAAARGENEIARMLLGYGDGADPTIQDQNGQTAMDLAKENGHDEMVTILESGGLPGPKPVAVKTEKNKGKKKVERRVNRGTGASKATRTKVLVLV